MPKKLDNNAKKYTAGKTANNQSHKYPIALLVLFSIILIWSAINPHDYPTWILEVFPAIIAAIILIATYRGFRFSNFTYTMIFLHATILAIGGHYTYAEVPLGFWMQEWFGWTRNNYDKIGHLVQGLVPAIVAREFLLRNAIVKGKYWLNYIVISICLAISAAYELIEWLVAALSKEAADSFLGTQGYIWDTQSDMLYCLIGAMIAVFALYALHDSSIARLKNPTK